jgi:hypothetical protein
MCAAKWPIDREKKRQVCVLRHRAVVVVDVHEPPLMLIPIARLNAQNEDVVPAEQVIGIPVADLAADVVIVLSVGLW